MISQYDFLTMNCLVTVLHLGAFSLERHFFLPIHKGVIVSEEDCTEMIAYNNQHPREWQDTVIISIWFNIYCNHHIERNLTLRGAIWNIRKVSL